MEDFFATLKFTIWMSLCSGLTMAEYRLVQEYVIPYFNA